MAGQILWGEGSLQGDEVNQSKAYALLANGKIQGDESGSWTYDADGFLHLTLEGDAITDLIPHIGQDWENETRTVLFTGLNKSGFSVWGKRIE